MFFSLKRRAGSVVLICLGGGQLRTTRDAQRHEVPGSPGRGHAGHGEQCEHTDSEGAEFTHCREGLVRPTVRCRGRSVSCTDAFILLSFILGFRKLNAQLIVFRLCYRAWIEMVLIAVCGNRHISFSSASPLLFPFPTAPKETRLPSLEPHCRSGLHRHQPSQPPINPTALLQLSCGTQHTFQLASNIS